MFPNAKLTLNLTSTNRLTMAFNRRVDRPGEPELRIFPKYDDPEILKVGNPFLRPQFTNVYEVGFSRSWVGGTGSAAVYHRDVSDAFLRIFAIDDSNPSYDIVNRIFENAGNFRQTGVQLTASQEIVRALADDRQRELVPERHRGARYDTVLPDADGRSRCPARRTTPGT